MLLSLTPNKVILDSFELLTLGTDLETSAPGPGRSVWECVLLQASHREGGCGAA